MPTVSPAKQLASTLRRRGNNDGLRKEDDPRREFRVHVKQICLAQTLVLGEFPTLVRTPQNTSGESAKMMQNLAQNFDVTTD